MKGVRYGTGKVANIFAAITKPTVRILQAQENQWSTIDDHRIFDICESNSNLITYEVNKNQSKIIKWCVC